MPGLFNTQLEGWRLAGGIEVKPSLQAGVLVQTILGQETAEKPGMLIYCFSPVAELCWAGAGLRGSQQYRFCLKEQHLNMILTLPFRNPLWIAPAAVGQLCRSPHQTHRDTRSGDKNKNKKKPYEHQFRMYCSMSEGCWRTVIFLFVHAHSKKSN